jgi:hypothetical protein
VLKEIAQADDLLSQLKQLNAKARELAAKAESAGDYRTALMAVRELTRLLELTGRITGELDERAHHNELHGHLPPDRALAVARTYLERHGARSIEDDATAGAPMINEEENGNETTS